MATKNKKSSLLPVIVIVLLLGGLLVARMFKKSVASNNSNPANTASTQKESRGLNRAPASINYSRHARCRMDCRHIDASEVKEILEDGKINYSKSELEGEDCNKKYAVEGTTHDQQRVRIIFAPCEKVVTVVTVIDIGREWACDCP